MRLVRFGEKGQEKPGVLLDGTVRDCSAYFGGWDGSFLDAGGLDALASVVARQPDSLPTVPDTVRLGAPIARPGKIVCIGLNYHRHAEEAGLDVPAEPLLFLKAPNCIAGPTDPILIPRGAEKTDWEVELGIIVGKEARYLDSPAAARDCIAGYALSNDLSERSFQFDHSGGQWSKGKCCDGFNPLGPVMVTADEIGDPQALSLSLSVNGVEKQKGHTSDMIFSVHEIIHHLSHFMTLEPGDLINTGTPFGVGMGLTPPEYLKPGDLLEAAIDGLGSHRMVCESA